MLTLGPDQAGLDDVDARHADRPRDPEGEPREPGMGHDGPDPGLADGKEEGG